MFLAGTRRDQIKGGGRLAEIAGDAAEGRHARLAGGEERRPDGAKMMGTGRPAGAKVGRTSEP
jgi:hypothetical protein